VDPTLVVRDPAKPLADGLAPVVLRALPGLDQGLIALAAHCRFAGDTAFAALPEPTRNALLYGSDGEEITVQRRGGGTARRPFAGIIPLLERRQRETRAHWLREEIEDLVAEARCAVCDGTRLRPAARLCHVGRRRSVDASARPI